MNSRWNWRAGSASWFERGPGGAVINYTRQMCDAQNAVMALVAGGVLDRFPKAQVAIIESGASWLAALAERMDEVYEAHAIFVRPKLSLPPSGVIRRQVKASFQYDRACVMSREVTGTQFFGKGVRFGVMLACTTLPLR